MAVALAALDAVVHVEGPGGTRAIPLDELHRLPGDEPHRDTVLEHGDLILAVELPPLPLARRSTYRKVRERASFSFAVVSVAAALELDGDTVADVLEKFVTLFKSPPGRERYEVLYREVPTAAVT